VCTYSSKLFLDHGPCEKPAVSSHYPFRCEPTIRQCNKIINPASPQLSMFLSNVRENGPRRPFSTLWAFHLPRKSVTFDWKGQFGAVSRHYDLVFSKQLRRTLIMVCCLDLFRFGLEFYVERRKFRIERLTQIRRWRFDYKTNTVWMKIHKDSGPDCRYDKDGETRKNSS
jgi:hypothetical protein